MEKNKEKKSFFRKWIQRIGFALGITASTLTLGSGDVHANEIEVKDKNHVTVTDTYKAEATSNQTLATSNLEKIIAENNAIANNGQQTTQVDDFTQAIHKANDTARGITGVISSTRDLLRNAGNVGRATNINSAVNSFESAKNSFENTVNNANTVNSDFQQTNAAVSQVLSTQDKTTKVTNPQATQTQTKEVEQTESTNVSRQEEPEVTTTSTSIDEKNDSYTMSDNEFLARDIIANTHFRVIKYNPLDKEDLLSEQIIQLQQKIGEANYNGNKELANLLSLKVDSLKEERIALTKARLEQQAQPKVATNSNEYQARNITPQKANELTAFAENVKEDWTPGKKLAHYSDGLIELNMSIEGFIKNNNPETYTIDQRKNYYDILSHLLQVYVRTEREAISLQKEIAKNPTDPANKLEFPTPEVKQAQKIEVAPTPSSITVDQPKVKIDKKIEKETKTKSIKSPESSFKELPPQVYNPSTGISEKVETKQAQVTKTNIETTSIENYNNTNIDESKLADVSVGQMGIYDDEPEEKEEKRVGEIDIEKLFDVSSGQMGIWDEIDAILDDELEKQAQQTTQTKSKDTDDRDER